VNSQASATWFTNAADQGEIRDKTMLGTMYYEGVGVLKNLKTAVKWYTEAAKQGSDDAQNNLASMYSGGEGVLTDNRRAYMWWNLSSYNGNEMAGENKDKIAKQMIPADISKAQDMSSRCLESNYTDC
jgi:TPR repeat protein